MKALHRLSIPLVTLVSVSYTHLDVYKRQGGGHAPGGRPGAGPLRDGSGHRDPEQGTVK